MKNNTVTKQACAQLQFILELMKRHNASPDDEDILNEIYENPLEVTVRSGWLSPADYEHERRANPEEWCILLCTGGPAVRIRGVFNRYSVPYYAVLEYQDWGIPWTEYRLTSDETEALSSYASHFYHYE